MRVKTFYRVLRLISAVVLFFFIWTFGPVWQAVAFAATPQGQGTSDKGHAGAYRNTPIQTASERFEKALEGIRAGVTKAGEKAGRGEDVAAEVAGIKAKKAEIEKIDIDLRAEFSATEKKLKDAKLPQVILDRHMAFVKNYEKNLTQLKSEIDDIDKAKTASDLKARIETTRLHLEKVKPAKKHVPLDPNNLPNRRVKAKARAPRTTSEEFQRDFLKQKTQGKKKVADSRLMTNLLATQISGPVGSIVFKSGAAIEHKPILVASNGPLTGLLSSDSKPEMPALPISETSVPPAVNDFRPQSVLNLESGTLNLASATTVVQPTADDLSETPEIQFTQDIQALAAQLNYNPVSIYNWVRNNIEYAPTYGSIQGAEACFQSKQCNDFDTASLLIALLRASNIYAHYVYGTIEVPIDKVMNWVGGFTDQSAALKYIANSGIPVTGVRSGGTIYAAQMEHVWVEAWIDYIPSRGAVQRQGNTWIPLDASFKQYTYKSGLDVKQITGFDPSSFANSLINSGVTNTSTGSITGIDTTLIQTQLDQVKTSLESYINNLQNPTVGDVIGSKNIITQQLEILPASLPYKTVLAGSKYAEVPDSLQYKVGISIYDPQSMTQSMDVTYSTAYLAGKRITIAYMPATQADATTLQNYGYYNTPPYLVNLKPVLNIDGATVSTGGSTGMGMTQELSVTFIVPNGSTDIITHKISASTYASIGLDLQKVSKSLLDQRSAQLSAAGSLLGQQDVAVDDIIGETLNLHNLGYFTQTETTNRMIATGKVAYSKQPAEMLATLAPTISYIYGVPYSISSLGTNLDVKRYPINAVSLRGNASDEKGFMTVSGTIGSAYEHTIIEELHQDGQAVSAVKILSIANQQGIPIYTIDSTNSATILPLLRISAETMSDIQNAIAAGKRVTIPGQSIQYYDWHGDGYIVTDPDTGAGAYVISGGLNGSGTATTGDQLSNFFGDILKNFAFDFTDAMIKFLFKLGSGIASKFSIIAGYITMSISAWKTYDDMYNNTGNTVKAESAAVLDLSMSVISAAYISAIMFAATGFGAAIVGILLVAIIATLVEMLLLALIQYAYGPRTSREKYFAVKKSSWRYSYAA